MSVDLHTVEPFTGTMRCECAWCGASMGTQPCAPAMHGKVTHGICDACVDIHFPGLKESPHHALTNAQHPAPTGHGAGSHGPLSIVASSSASGRSGAHSRAEAGGDGLLSKTGSHPYIKATDVSPVRRETDGHTLPRHEGNQSRGGVTVADKCALEGVQRYMLPRVQF